MPNVELKDPRKVTTVSLPSFPESKVELYESVLFSEMRQLEKVQNDSERGLLTLKFMIKDWNFTDEKGEKIEVNEENLGKLPIQDLTMLLEKVGEFFEKITKKKEKPSKS